MFKRWSSDQKLFGLVVLGGVGFLTYRLLRDTIAPSTTTTAGTFAGWTPTTVVLPTMMPRAHNPALIG